MNFTFGLKVSYTKIKQIEEIYKGFVMYLLLQYLLIGIFYICQLKIIVLPSIIYFQKLTFRKFLHPGHGKVFQVYQA